MINPKVDEQSMMTYLSQYPNARVKPGAPVKPTNHANQVRCYGSGKTFGVHPGYFYGYELNHSGLERTGHLIDKPVTFHIETCAAGLGNVDVIVVDPNGQTEEVSIQLRLRSPKFH